ncbi:MAG: hypothetical protein H7Y17_06540, partial [Chlorobia bacterium]|nr:hypothetical protein [Fimbriimonadaceae bacterium]
NLGLYTLNGSIQGREQMRNIAEYIVSTGRSWKGNIGSTKVIFEFTKASIVRAPITLGNDHNASDRYDEVSFWVKNRGLIRWSGFANPRLEGRKVIFERKNWEPKSEDDDPHLKFGMFPKPKY